MTLNERILDFMDGTLPAEDEAELLHILSVSPERRNLLRSFMNQAALFARDKQSIQVPYAAEQKLWERLGPLMPILPAMESAPAAVDAITQEAPVVPTSNNRAVPLPISFFSRALNSTALAIGTITLMLGLGLGYIAGADQPVQVRTVYLDHAATPNNNTTVEAIPGQRALSGSEEPAQAMKRIVQKLAAQNSTNVNAISAREPALSELNAPAFDLPVIASNPPSPLDFGSAAIPLTLTTAQLPLDNITERVPSISMRNAERPSLGDIGGENAIRPVLLHTSELPDPAKSLIERFEFSFNESFGREYPNSIATNTTLPIITNSAVGAFFQILPRSNALWIGASYGTANLTRKNLKTYQDPLDPLQTVLSSDTVHSQASYLAGFLQYRVPIMHSMDLTFTGGYGLASIGRMIMGEFGLHYDVSKEVGFLVGLRALEFHYDLSQQFNHAISSGNSSLVIAKGVSSAAPSYNVELNTGLFFHF